MRSFLQDIRYGVRMLGKNAGFTAVAVVTLALGIGANTAIFTLIDAVMLQNLPVREPARLAVFYDGPSEGVQGSDPPPTGDWRYFSSSSYEFFRDHNEVFEGLAAFESSRFGVVLREGDQRARLGDAKLVSGNYFSVLGVNATLGRTLRPEDDRTGAPPVAVLSHRVWEREFASDPGVVGRTVGLNGTAFTIVGVLPAEFFGVSVQPSPDFWLPMQTQPQAMLEHSWLTPDAQDIYWLNLVGRLRPGVTQEQAQAAMTVALRQFLLGQAGAAPSQDTRDRIAHSSIVLASGARGISNLRWRYSQPLHLLMGIVGLVLLIACANVATLLLSRGAAREKEMATRLALGAGRGRLVRQLLTEGVVLSLVAGLLGLLLAEWGVGLLITMFTRGSTPLRVAPDPAVLGFTLGLALLTGILFTLAPAIRVSGIELVPALKASVSSAPAGRLRLGAGKGLVVFQVAVSFLLLVCSGLLVRSLGKLEEQPLGFEPGHVLTVTIDPRGSGYASNQLPGLYRSLSERVNAVPGVQSAAMALYSPFSGSTRSSNVSVEGYTPQKGEDMDVEEIPVGPRYFETLGMPLAAGRALGEQDIEGAPDAAVVNQAFVRAYVRGANPVGKKFCFDSEFKAEKAYEIVGVTGDARTHNLREEPEPTVFVSAYQPLPKEIPYLNEIEVRAAGDAAALAPSVRQAIAEVAPQLAIPETRTITTQMRESFKRERSIAELSSAFGLLAVVLGCVGLYGLMGYAVSRRTRDIGIRMALGEKPAEVLRSVLRESGWLLLLGLAIGIPLAVGAGRLIASQLFGVATADPAALGISALLLGLVVLIAAFVPARRAMRTDPMIALRYE